MAITRKPPTLVVLQLTGGNDALNTLVPYGNPLYYDQRPTVRIPEDQVLPIDEHYGFHPSMAALKPFWDQGKMAIVNGIGYPKPDYSHFRSMDIWYTAQPETMATDGWLGKLVHDLDPKADNVLTAVSFGRGLPRALSLAGVPVASVAELDSYGLLTNLSSVQRQAALEVEVGLAAGERRDREPVLALRQPVEGVQREVLVEVEGGVLEEGRARDAEHAPLADRSVGRLLTGELRDARQREAVALLAGARIVHEVVLAARVGQVAPALARRSPRLPPGARAASA